MMIDLGIYLYSKVRAWVYWMLGKVYNLGDYQVLERSGRYNPPATRLLNAYIRGDISCTKNDIIDQDEFTILYPDDTKADVGSDSILVIYDRNLLVF